MRSYNNPETVLLDVDADGETTSPATPVLESSPEPDPRTRRIVTVAQIGLGYSVACFGPYLAGLAAELGRPRGGLVWVTSTFGIGLVLAAIAGPAVLRLGAGRILRVALLAMCIGATAMALTPALPIAGAGSVLVGLGSAVVALTTPALLRGPGAARRLSIAVGVASAAGVAAPLAYGALESLGQPGRLALLLPVPVLLAGFAWRSVASSGEGPAARSRPSFGPSFLGWLRIVLAVGCEFCFVVWAVARLADTGVALGTASALGAVFGIGMAAGRFIAPRFVDRSWAVAAAAVTTMVGTALVYIGQDAATVAAGIAIASVGIAPLYPVMLARLVSTPGLTARHSASIGSLASGAAVLTAPTALGWLDSGIGLREAFLLPIPLMLLLLALAARRRDTDEAPDVMLTATRPR
ncbi:MFS transporter [Glycomyces buryatensis]|uniref:MFS transporter n=1 Tax=Glycomyces buryatensis TaxID=2570927 RepID=A0A4S8Q7J5_9ACTN|nr:MFS transporter [Glycomyces buryatensis]THV40218.1 MFS transporter [Glycomyces buryatensis]